MAIRRKQSTITLLKPEVPPYKKGVIFLCRGERVNNNALVGADVEKSLLRSARLSGGFLGRRCGAYGNAPDVTMIPFKSEGPAIIRVFRAPTKN